MQRSKPAPEDPHLPPDRNAHRVAQPEIAEMIHIGIDPGTTQSALLILTDRIEKAEIMTNYNLIYWARNMGRDAYYGGAKIAIEMIASYGMPVGKEVFETVLLIGQLEEAMRFCDVTLVYRKDIKMHFCHSMKATDANIRQALIDRYGAPGTKKAPGFTYGIKADMWSALAIATYHKDKWNSTQSPN